MASKLKFTLHYWKDGDFYVGELIEVPGVMSQGETLPELKENILDAYQLMLAERKRDTKAHGRARSISIAVPA